MEERNHISSNHWKAGFTFLELLLAVAISGLILSASAQLMFSFGNFWRQTELEPRFEHHVEGVVSFVQYCLDESEKLSPNPDSPFGWKNAPGVSQKVIQFRLAAPPPFFVTDIRPVPQVDGWLYFDEDKGLTILWQVPAKLTEGKTEIMQTPISPWVEDLELGYFDAENNTWEYESSADEKNKSTRTPPGALRILFNQDGRKKTRDIRLLRHDRNVLIY
jgi:prepilin-type N-terminal cleavage/methylation domain-containing protein